MLGSGEFHLASQSLHRIFNRLVARSLTIGPELPDRPQVDIFAWVADHRDAGFLHFGSQCFKFLVGRRLFVETDFGKGFLVGEEGEARDAAAGQRPIFASDFVGIDSHIAEAAFVFDIGQIAQLAAHGVAPQILSVQIHDVYLIAGHLGCGKQLDIAFAGQESPFNLHAGVGFLDTFDKRRVLVGIAGAHHDELALIVTCCSSAGCRWGCRLARGGGWCSRAAASKH